MSGVQARLPVSGATVYNSLSRSQYRELAVNCASSALRLAGLSRLTINRKGFTMFDTNHSRTLLVVGCAILLFLPTWAEAQIVERFLDGSVAVRAPFVQVDVGPGGGTSVSAPFVAVRNTGEVRLGRRQRRRLRKNPELTEEQAALSPRARRREARALRRNPNPEPPGPQPQMARRSRPLQPTPAQPHLLPTARQLANLDDTTLRASLRNFSTELTDSLERFDKAEGWQHYLAIPSATEPGALKIQLARFDKVATQAEFAKIASLPSFASTHAALGLVVERATDSRTLQAVPDPFDDSQFDPGPVTKPIAAEPLPAPPPSPEPRSGQHSILKRR